MLRKPVIYVVENVQSAPVERKGLCQWEGIDTNEEVATLSATKSSNRKVQDATGRGTRPELGP